jgi:pimeloyl-ACP methyl ester carboxylesterase
MARRTRTHYVEVGDNGIPIILVHGGGVGISCDFYFDSILDILGERFWTIALDSVGGYGETDPSAPVPEGLQSRVDHLADFIDALCLDQVYLAGNSQGAWVAAKYTRDHPDIVRKLFLLASGTIANAMDIEGTSGGREPLDGSAAAMRKRLSGLIHDRALITDAMVQRSLDTAARPGMAEAQKAFAEGMKHLRDPRLALKYEMHSWLPRLQTPTTFVWGENDESALPAWGHALEKMLPAIPFHWVPKAGHRLWVDQPEMVSRRMLDFFSPA